MYQNVLRCLSDLATHAAPGSGRTKTASLFVPRYRSGQSIRLHALPAGRAIARRRLGRLIEGRRRTS